MTTQLDTLIKKMVGARSRLNAAMQQVTPQVELYPSWKLKQLMDHITGWDELVVDAFRSIAQGANPEVTIRHGIDQFNEESVKIRKDFSLEKSRQAYDAAREEVFTALQAIPVEKHTQKVPAPWGGMCTVASILKIFISHETEHAEAIEGKLKG